MSITPHEERQALNQVLAQSGCMSLPAGTSGTPFAQTFDRRFATTSAFAPTSGVLTLTAIYLTAKQIVSGITFVSGIIGQLSGSHLWYALYRDNLSLLAQTADDTGATAFAANTALRKPLLVPQVLPYSGLYYLGLLCTVVIGTMPTLVNVGAVLPLMNGSILGMAPILSGTSTVGLADIAPDPADPLTAISQSLYAFVD